MAAANRIKPAFVIITGDLTNKAGNAGRWRSFTGLRRSWTPR